MPQRAREGAWQEIIDRCRFCHGPRVKESPYCPWSMDGYLPYACLRWIKFVAVMVYAAAAAVGLGPFALEARKWAVHRAASPALIVIWLAGFGLTLTTGVAIAELWVALGFVGSLGTQLLLVQSLRQSTAPPRLRVAVFLFLSAIVALMIFRPTWRSLPW